MFIRNFGLRVLLISIFLVVSLAGSICAEPIVIDYENSDADSVAIAGDWNGWAGSVHGDFEPDEYRLEEIEPGVWQYRLAGVEAGKHEYKFVVDGEWETGENRTIFINETVPSIRREVSPYLQYFNPDVDRVAIAGSWNDWAGSARGNFTPLKYEAKYAGSGWWKYDLSHLEPGRYQYKFIIDGEWEGGNNRILHINKSGQVYFPAHHIKKAKYEDLKTVKVEFADPISNSDNLKFSLDEGLKISSWKFTSQNNKNYKMGFRIDGSHVVFLFNDRYYSTNTSSQDQIYVAGSFNGWGSAVGKKKWKLNRQNGRYKLRVPLSELKPATGARFKFVKQPGQHWLKPNSEAPNFTKDDEGNANLRLIPGMSKKNKVEIKLAEKLDPAQKYVLTVKGYQPAESSLQKTLSPGKILYEWEAKKQPGVHFDVAAKKTSFRLFAPRAKWVKLYLYEKPTGGEAYAVHKMVRNQNGLWEYTVDGLKYLDYYQFQLDGPDGPGEGFNPQLLIADPYARANVGHDGRSIVIPDNWEGGKYFQGWTDQNFTPPPENKWVISEVHIGDLTRDQSIDLPSRLRGTYKGVAKSVETEKAIGQLIDLGVNVVEFMPVHENPTIDYTWGYMPTLFDAPENGYGTGYKKGQHLAQLKGMINKLHNVGLAVILDVVYTHVGAPNYHAAIDRKYYFRLNDDFTYKNFSGCGNDLQTETPMTEQMIIDSLVYQVRQLHVDGFRFDLAELLNYKTLKRIEKRVQERVDRKVKLIAEPWSYRGAVKKDLRGSDWASWNDRFRDDVKSYVLNKSEPEKLKRVVEGSIDYFAGYPGQVVNYLASHDDRVFIDKITQNPNHNGTNPTETDIKRSKLAAMLLFTSLGTPLITEGQDFLRSKGGRDNTYQNPQINQVNWNRRERFKNVSDYFKNLIHFRKSSAGKATRLFKRAPPSDYIRWLRPLRGSRSNALGYILNDNSYFNAPPVMSLLNPGDREVTFRVRLKEGTWVQAANGSKVRPEGLRGNHLNGGRTHRLTVPGRSAALYYRSK